MGNRYAVIIGIDKYADTSIPNLSCAVNDAKAMYDILTNPTMGRFSKDNVKLLLDNEATLRNILEALGGYLERNARKEDTVIMYYSGHGCSDTDTSGKYSDNMSKYLVPYDAEGDKPFSSALDMTRVADIFERIDSERIVFFADTCFSGMVGGRTFVRPGFKGSGDMNDEFIENISGTGVLVITACGVNELASEDASSGQGFFTNRVLEGLKGKADLNNDNEVDVIELFEYLVGKVYDDSRRIGRQQTPMLKGEVCGIPFPLTFVFKESRKVPIITFFGTQGGVGKTTITNKFADIVLQAKSRTNVLIIDLDIETMATTISRVGRNPFACKTMHEYISARSTIVDDVIDITTIKKGADPNENHLYLIPSIKSSDAKHGFRVAANIESEELFTILKSLINSAVEKYDISCVLIDCEARIDFPYTAAAAHISDRAFIIGRNEPPTWAALNNYTDKIKGYYDDFDSMKMKVILNQIRNWRTFRKEIKNFENLQAFFAAIPYTKEIGDITEGKIDVNNIRPIVLDHYIHGMVKEIFGTFKQNYSNLVPDGKVVLPKEWRELIEHAPKLAELLRMKFYRISKIFLLFGGILTVIFLTLKFAFDIDQIFNIFSMNYLIGFIGALFIASAAVRWHYKMPAVYLDELISKKEEFLFERLETRSGREVLQRLKNWLDKLNRGNKI